LIAFWSVAFTLLRHYDLLMASGFCIFSIFPIWIFPLYAIIRFWRGFGRLRWLDAMMLAELVMVLASYSFVSDPVRRPVRRTKQEDSFASMTAYRIWAPVVLAMWISVSTLWQRERTLVQRRYHDCGIDGRKLLPRARMGR
jgi:hypothetical protein